MNQPNAPLDGDDQDKGARPSEAGRFAYAGLDRLFHERARLSILSSLVAHAEGVSFNDLKQLCQLTDGNLSRHLQMLVEADLIEIHKGSHHNRPLTLVRLTQTGRHRFLDYIACLENVVADAVEASRLSDGPELSPA
jgi:DNA-binding MarR family transcriptional regulator